MRVIYSIFFAEFLQTVQQQFAKRFAERCCVELHEPLVKRRVSQSIGERTHCLRIHFCLRQFVCSHLILGITKLTVTFFCICFMLRGVRWQSWVAPPGQSLGSVGTEKSRSDTGKLPRLRSSVRWVVDLQYAPADRGVRKVYWLVTGTHLMNNH